MPDPDQDVRDALAAVRRAAMLLERRYATTTADSATEPVADAAEPSAGTRVPLSLMRMALALMDRDGEASSTAACFLQSAIDHIGRPATKPR